MGGNDARFVGAPFLVGDPYPEIAPHLTNPGGRLGVSPLGRGRRAAPRVHLRVQVESRPPLAGLSAAQPGPKRLRRNAKAECENRERTDRWLVFFEGSPAKTKRGTVLLVSFNTTG